MKIIEALKQSKDLMRKAQDIRNKLKEYCADLDMQTPEYGTEAQQREQINKWLQMHSDILKEIENLRLSIQRTNLQKEVSVEVKDGQTVTKSIAAWIHRRKDLAALEAESWKGLTNKRLTPQNYKLTAKDEDMKIANVRKYYDQKIRDEKVEQFTSESSRIDAALEIANAVTDLA